MRKARRDAFPGCNGNERVSQSRLDTLRTHSSALKFAAANNGKQLRSHVQQRCIKIEFRPRAPPNTNPEAQSPARTCLSNQPRRFVMPGHLGTDELHGTAKHQEAERPTKAAPGRVRRLPVLEAEGSASSDAGYVVTDFGPAAETHGGGAAVYPSGKRSEVTPGTNELKF